MHASVRVIESYDTADFPLFSALYDDDVLDVSVWVSGNSVRNDYGVPGSPVWYEIEDIMVEEYEINGVCYTHNTLAAKFGADLAENLHEISAEVAEEKGDWE